VIKMHNDLTNVTSGMFVVDVDDGSAWVRVPFTYTWTNSTRLASFTVANLQQYYFVRVTNLISGEVSTIFVREREYVRLAAGQPANVTVRRNLTYQINVVSNVTRPLTYVSSMPTAALVSQSGLVTGRAPGIAVIRIFDPVTGAAANVVVNVIN